MYFPYANHHIAQTPNLVVQDPKAYSLPYAPEMQIFYGTNRPVSIPNSWQQFEGLAKTFNVVIDIVMSESAWYADIVLPDKTYLESWHWAPTRSTPDTSHMAIRQPMVNPYNLQWDAFSMLWELMQTAPHARQVCRRKQQVLGSERQSHSKRAATTRNAKVSK